LELDVRGTSAEQIRGYLQGLGGRPQPDGSVAGPDWTAELAVGEHAAFGTLVPRVIITLRGDPEVVAAVTARLKLRATRVGG